jgi:hypothetical protein
VLERNTWNTCERCCPSKTARLFERCTHKLIFSTAGSTESENSIMYPLPTKSECVGARPFLYDIYPVLLCDVELAYTWTCS